ncbi:NAD(P)/FAD-dependent oxidoreductase [Chitinophaga costaii]|nr:NAD(P)/FAD-dependent oxidoreductase [Chitinophaga costaii]
MDSMQQLSLNVPDTVKLRVVVIGGGFGGVAAVKHLDSRLFQVVLFDKHNYNSFWPLLYQVATAGLQAEAIAGPLRREFNQKKDFHFRPLKVQSVDVQANTLHTQAGDLSYDYLIIANGSKSNYFGNKSMQQYAFGLKSIPDALNLRSQLIQAFERAVLTSDLAERARILTIVLVGAGPTGVETAGALAELRKYVLPKDYPTIDFSQMKIYLLDGLDRVLPPMSVKASEKAHRYLEKMGVIIRTNTLVDSYDGAVVKLKSGEEIQSYSVIWSAGVTGDILQGLPPEWAEKGRLLTDENCRIIGSKNIFAIGDIAAMKTTAYPKGHPGLAQPAMQMGTYLGKNMQALHLGENVKPFKYFDKGSLATVGRGKAVADLPGKLHFGGRIAWYIWLFVHISFLISFRNKLLVFVNWMWNYFTFDKANRLIIRPYVRKGDAVAQEVFLENEEG